MKRLLKHGHDLLKKLGVKMPCCEVEAKEVIWLTAVAEFNKKYREWENFKKEFGEKHEDRIVELNTALERRRDEAWEKIKNELREKIKNELREKIKNELSAPTKKSKGKKIKIEKKNLPMKQILEKWEAFNKEVDSEEIHKKLHIKK